MKILFNLKKKKELKARTFYGNKREMEYVEFGFKKKESPVVDKFFSGLKSSVCTDDFGVVMANSFDLLKSNLKAGRQF